MLWRNARVTMVFCYSNGTRQLSSDSSCEQGRPTGIILEMLGPRKLWHLLGSRRSFYFRPSVLSTIVLHLLAIVNGVQVLSSNVPQNIELLVYA